MEKKTIKALSNFGDAIDTLVEELKKQNQQKATTGSFMSNLFGKDSLSKRVKSIQDGINKIKEDTQKIIKNQEDFMNIRKQENKGKEGGVFEKSGESSNIDKIKQGVGSIILIAGAVLALGAAFNIIDPSKFDIPLIVAISFSMTLMGMALAKIMEAGVPNPAEALSIGLALIAMSGAVVVTGALMALIPKIEPYQFMTFLGIAATFTLMFALGFSKAIEASGKMKAKSIIMLPLALIGISAAIMASSHILQYAQEIDGSKLWNLVQQGLALAAIALFISIPLFILGKVGLGNVLMGSLALVLVAGALTLSSMMLAHGNWENPIPLNWALSFSVTMLLLAIPVAILGAIGLQFVIPGAIGLVIVAAALVAASWLLSFIKPDFFYTISDAIAYFVNVVGGAVIKFAKNFLPILVSIAGAFMTKILPPLAKFINAIIPTLGNFLETIINSFFPYFEQIMDYMKFAVGQIDNIILAIGTVLEKIGGVLGKVGDVFRAVGDSIATVLDSVGSIIDKIAKGIMGVFKTVTESILSLSQVDGGNLLQVGAGLLAIGGGLAAMTAGSIIKGIGDFFTGDGLTDQLKNLSEFHKEIFMTGKGIEMLATGLESINDVDIDSDRIEGIVQVLDKVTGMRASADAEIVTRQIIETGNLIQELKGLTEPDDNSEMLNELKKMNQRLEALISTNSGIGAMLGNMGTDEEPKLEY